MYEKMMVIIRGTIHFENRKEEEKMKKLRIISYLIGIFLGICLLVVFSNLSFFTENIRSEVLIHSYIHLSKSKLLNWALFFIGILFVVSAYQTNFYIKNPDDKAPLYFSLYCWMTIIAVITTIFPYGSWITILKLVYIATYLTILILHFYIHSFLNKQAHPFVSYFIWIFASVMILFTIITDIQFLVGLYQYSILLSVSYLIYITFLSFQKLLDRTPRFIENFISILILTVTNIQHLLVGFHLIEGESLQGMGLIIFFIIHSALNMERFLTSYSETQEMKHLLQEKVKERTMELERANREMIIIQNEKSQLISNICHDLSNPITSISMVTKGIIDDVIPATNKQYLVEIHNKSNLMEKLLADLRQLNMLESNQINFHFEKLDWYHFTESMFNNYRAFLRSESIQYELHFEKTLEQDTAVMIDPLRMEQVFLNLISNSVKHTPGGGSIDVSVGLDEKIKQAFLTISDNGTGIDSNQLPLIYNRFYRTDPARTDKESTGLGLNIVENIIIKHKGSIHVESEKGLGTNFTINIPLAVE